MSVSPILNAILAPGGLSTVFQPVVEVRGNLRRIHSLECLIRGPRGSNVEQAPVLFEYVRRKREEGPVDRACVAAALGAVCGMPEQFPVSVNVHASTLERDPEFVGFLADEAKAPGIALSRLTVDIVEHAQPWNARAIEEAVDALRHIGVALALDDVGLGHGRCRLMIECQPDYFKVDGYVVAGCRCHHYRRAILESLVDLAGKVGARVIAEGVEDEGDFAALSSMGVVLFQGNLLCPALPADQLRATDLWPQDELTVWDA